MGESIERQRSETYLRTPIGTVVKAWREQRGLTLTDLARRAGRPITKGYLSQLEQDKIHQPSHEKLAQLAEALGIAVLDLITRRMPHDRVPDHDTGTNPLPTPTATRDTTRLRAGFGFGSPLTAAQPQQPATEEEQLQLALARIEELHTLIAQLISDRKRGHDRRDG